MAVIDRERWRELEPLLDRALELADEERTAFLGELRSSAPDLAAELTALLSGEVAADERGFLAQPVEPTLEGLQLGAYTLERPLGQGGMGTVWLARRSDGRFEGRVAVKFLNLGLLSAKGQERFRREGSVLARVTHPGIARLLDAGVSPSGQPYLVLEYVEGERINDFADARRLTPAERIRLLLQVLSAVGHAHTSLVVHRDLKPSNILVTADGTAKLLDFGIAKLLAAEDDAEGTALTGDGRALTPAFAAPEQMRGSPITTATDVYAVGVILYTLLTGVHPYELGDRPAAEIERIVCETEPPRPSATLARGTGGEDGRTDRARSRGGTPDRLRRQLRGDLDAIVMKALRKEPERRYASAAALTDDLQRYLDGRPVLARPASAGYRLRRYVRRHRVGLLGVVAVALLAGIYLATLIISRGRIRRALAEAQVGAQKAEQVADFAVGLFEASQLGPAYADTVSARELLARGLTQARELSGQPAVQAQMLDLIGRIHAQRGESDQARRVHEEALAIRRRTLGEDHPDVAASLANLAAVIGWSGRSGQSADAVPLLRRALEIRQRHFGADDPRTIDALYRLSGVMHMAGDHRAARPLLDAWMTAVLRGPRQVTPDRAEQLLAAAGVLEIGRRFDDAERLAREALVLNRALYGETHPRVATNLSRLATVLDEDGRYAEADTLHRAALAILRRSYPDGHPELAHTLRQRGNNLMTAKRFAEAEPVWREAAALYGRFFGDTSVHAAGAMVWAGIALRGQERYAEAVASLRETLRTYGAVLTASSLLGVRARLALGDALRAQGQLDEAESLLVAGYAVASRRARMDPVSNRFALEALVRLYEARGRPDEAAKYRGLRDAARPPR